MKREIWFGARQEHYRARIYHRSWSYTQTHKSVEEGMTTYDITSMDVTKESLLSFAMKCSWTAGALRL